MVSESARILSRYFYVVWLKKLQKFLLFPLLSRIRFIIGKLLTKVKQKAETISLSNFIREKEKP